MGSRIDWPACLPARAQVMRRSVCLATLVLGCLLIAAGQGRAEPTEAARRNLDTLIKTGSCRDCDLAGLNLTRMNLRGVNLEGADLSFAKLFLVDLSEANLRNARLTGAVFGGADLGAADLRGADLRGSNLEGAYLQDARMDGKFVLATPYREAGVPELEKEVYIEDPARPKRIPEKSEIKEAAPENYTESSSGPEVQNDHLSAAAGTGEVMGEQEVDEIFRNHLPQPAAPKSALKLSPVVIEPETAVQPETDTPPAGPKAPPVMSKVELGPSQAE
jgi:hypothetical protein